MQGGYRINKLFMGEILTLTASKFYLKYEDIFLKHGRV